MVETDRRKYARVATSNLISHVGIDNEGNFVSHCMGKALNVSRSGVMIETMHPIDAEQVSLMTTDLENNLIEITGRLIYCRRAESGLYHAGICFIGSGAEISEFIVKMIKLYHHRKQNILLQVTA